jgi:hypothetical protein
MSPSTVAATVCAGVRYPYFRIPSVGSTGQAVRSKEPRTTVSIPPPELVDQVPLGVFGGDDAALRPGPAGGRGDAEVDHEVVGEPHDLRR